MEKYYSELTKQSYYTEAAKEADEKAYKEAMEEKEKQEQVLKETRETRVKEYNEAVNNLTKLRREYSEKYSEKYNEIADQMNKAWEDAKKQLDEEYLSKKKDFTKIIDQFEKDYPNGIYLSYKTGRSNTPLGKILDEFFSDSFLRDPFNSLFVNPSNIKRIR